MITREDLEEWMGEYGEDIISDGPFSFNNSQMEVFEKMINDNKKLKKFMVKDGYIYDIDDYVVFDDMDVSTICRSSDLILDEFVKFLHFIGINKIPKYPMND